jgi:hypothetical protein
LNQRSKTIKDDQRLPYRIWLNLRPEGHRIAPIFTKFEEGWRSRNDEVLPVAEVIIGILWHSIGYKCHMFQISSAKYPQNVEE